MEEPVKRYVGLDAHKQYCMVGAVDANQAVVLTPRRDSMSALEGWAQAHLSQTDEVV